MNIKKIHLYGVCCLLIAAPFLYAQEAIDFSNPFESETRAPQDFSFELNLDDIDSSLLEAAVQNRPATRELSPSEILTLLYSQAHINNILKNDLYHYTYPLPTRNILTYPSLLSFTPNDSRLGFNIFFQQTTNMFPWCNNIEGYMDLFDPTTLQSIDLEIARAKGVDIPRTIRLFKNARVEQRRIGFLFDAWKKIKRFNIGIELPLYIVEKNYNLPPEDILEIESADIFESTNDKKAEKKAYHQYAVETRLGLGDTRLSLGYDIFNNDRYRVVLGTKITLPTAATFSSGFIGSDFKKKVQRCYLDLEELIDNISSEDVALQEQAIAEGLNFGLKSVNQMGAMLLATQLGEDRRFQIGGYLEPTIRIDQKVFISGSLRANWMLPKEVSRFILESLPESVFDDSNFDPDSWGLPVEEENLRSEAAINFLDRRLMNVTFPCCYNVKLKAQREFQLTLASLFKFTGNWNFTLGYDFWHKQKECAESIKKYGSSINTDCIKECRALRPYATQQKLFTKVEYTRFKKSHDFTFGIGGDVPLLSTNIGDDITVFIKFDWLF